MRTIFNKPPVEPNSVDKRLTKLEEGMKQQYQINMALVQQVQSLFEILQKIEAIIKAAVEKE